MSGIESYKNMVIDCKIHLRQALLNILFNEIGDPTVTGIPKDPEELHNYLKRNKWKIEENKKLKDNQKAKAILFPNDTQRVDSKDFDVTLTRQLIYVFCNIKNARGDKGKPDKNDTTLWAYVYKAAEIRNEIFHEGDIRDYEVKKYEELWEEMKKILHGLKYKGDTRVFLQLLKEYKDRSSKNTSEEFHVHVERRLSVMKNKNEREIIYGKDVTAMGQVLEENDRVIIYGEAGIGKTYTSRQIKRDWSKEKFLPKSYLLYFKSKTINQRIKYRSREAPFFFSEMGEGRGKSDENFLIHDCVTRPIDDLLILVDGVDEFPINKLLNKDDVDELETKIKDDKEITAAETIYAIYYGFLFPNAKICLLGRKGEFQRLKEVEYVKKNSIFSDRETADLELLEFNKENIKDFTRFKLRDQEHNFEKIYEKVKDVDICKVPTDLNSCLELLKEQPNIDIGKITRTKILITTLLNRLNNHIYKRIYKRCKTFGKIRNEKNFDKYLDCIVAMAEISFNALLNEVVTVEGVVEERGYLKDKNNIRVNRTCLEELDLFYIRDDDDFTLEPYHTLSVEFLAACYLFSHKEKWDSILKLTKDRQRVVFALIAGLHVADSFTNDFVKNVFKISDYSLEKFFNWLYDLYPQILINTGGELKDRSCFLTPNQQISPSIKLLESIFHEVEVQDNLDLDSFLDRFQFKYYNRFPKHKFKIRFSNMNMDEENFDFMEKYKENNRVSIIIRAMYFCDIFESFFDFGLSLEVIEMGFFANSSSITKLLTALSSPFPSIKCKTLMIDDITKFNENQIRQLFALCLDGKVQTISLYHNMFTAEQITILKEMERRYTTKLINLGVQNLGFRDVLDLPNLGNRNLLLVDLHYVSDDNLREFRKHVIPGLCSKLSKYKILSSWNVFDQKIDNSQENDTLMSLHLDKVDFTNVTPEVFATTFRSIPSLACTDNDNHIPSSHWLRLSLAKGCQIQELRIWYPEPQNFEHFLNIRSRMIQFICRSKADLENLLNYIVNSQNVHLERKIKVFRVSFYEYHFETYEEVTLFSRETIKGYRDNCILDNSRIDEVQQTYYEGEEFNKYWCCEISMPIQKNADLCVVDCCDDNENSVKEIEDELSAIPKTDDLDNVNSLSDNESINEETDNSEKEVCPEVM